MASYLINDIDMYIKFNSCGSRHLIGTRSARRGSSLSWLMSSLSSNSVNLLKVFMGPVYSWSPNVKCDGGFLFSPTPALPNYCCRLILICITWWIWYVLNSFSRSKTVRFDQPTADDKLKFSKSELLKLAMASYLVNDIDMYIKFNSCGSRHLIGTWSALVM